MACNFMHHCTFLDLTKPRHSSYGPHEATFFLSDFSAGNEGAGAYRVHDSNEQTFTVYQ